MVILMKNEGFLQQMCPNLQFPADLVMFTEGILNGKFHFLYTGRLTCLK